MRLPMNRKIFSAYVGLDFESMHLNGERQQQATMETIAESENVCHDNLNSLYVHTTIKNRANYTNIYANMLLWFVRSTCAVAVDDEIILIKSNAN
jgi:hypothetical protein